MAAHRLVEFSVDLAGRHERAHFLEDLEVRCDAGAGFVDVSGTERDEQIAGLERVADFVVGGGEVWQIGGGDVAVDFHRIDQRLAGNAFDRFFRGGVNVGDEDDVGGLQDFSEIIGQRLRPGVAVRLEKDDEPLRLERAGGLERGGELGRMVAVVVDDPIVRGEIFGFEAALGPGEGGERAGDEREFRAAAVRQRDGGERVEHVVVSRDAELDVAEDFALFLHGESGGTLEIAEVGGGVVGVFPAVGNAVFAAGSRLRARPDLRRSKRVSRSSGRRAW